MIQPNRTTTITKGSLKEIGSGIDHKCAGGVEGSRGLRELRDAVGGGRYHQVVAGVACTIELSE